MRPFWNGERVKVDDCGQHHMATVIRDERYLADYSPTSDRVWVLLDAGDNPLWFHADELEVA